MTQKKKVRRGGRYKNKNIENKDIWTIYHNNIRGYSSKCVSFENIMSIVKPSVILLNETHLKNNRKLKLSCYNSFSRNRQNKYMGGISTSVQNQDAKHT